MERRSFLAFLGGATSHTLWETYKSGIVDPLVEPLKCWVAGSLSWGAIATPQTIHQRPELVWDIFFSSRLRTEFIPPTDWGPTVPDVQLPGGTKTYGHEASVLSSIANFLSLSGPL